MDDEWKMIPGPPVWLEWDGVRWYKRKKGDHYADANGSLLHVCVWERKWRKSLPLGWVVHHRDEDPTNNHWENLLAMTRRTHAIRHDMGTKLNAVKNRPALALALKQSWANRQPTARICVECGDTYYSTGMRSKLCSDDCRKSYAREYKRVRRVKTREIR